MLHFPDDRFYLREYISYKRCPAGSEITDVDECKEACKSLGISLANTFKDGKPCFKGGNGVCKQSGSIGRLAYLVCKTLSGKVTSLAIMSTKYNQCLILL